MDKKNTIEQIQSLKNRLIKINPDYERDEYLGIDSVTTPEYLTLKKRLLKMERRLQKKSKNKTDNNVPF